MGKKADFANTYRDEFFKWGHLVKDSVSTTLVRAAGLEFHKIPDIAKGRSVYMEFTNQFLANAGYDVPIFTPEQAGKQLAGLSVEYDLCLYEYFLTDRIAHMQKRELSIEQVRRIDEYLVSVVENTDLGNCTIIVSSDHGSIEDVTSIEHTLNPVPTFVWGEKSSEIANQITKITDIPKLIIRYLSE